MADRMEFPKTMKEFIEGYSFKDSDEVYTNGSELVPVFRVEQALEHYEQEIRNKAIDDVLEKLSEYDSVLGVIPTADLQGIIYVIEQLKGGAE